MVNRKEFLKRELIKKNLDVLLVYSNSEEFGLDLALNNPKPALFHYYFLDKSGKEGFLEIDCLIEDLKKRFNGKIIPLDESFPENSISKFLENYSCVAIAGNAPWFHLSKIKKEIINFNQELDKIIKQKETKEINKIREIARITFKILTKAKNLIRINKTQKQIEDSLKKEFLHIGDKLAFPICITSGKDIEKTTASISSNKKIMKKDIVCIDAGIVKNGFYSDCTRMFFINNSKAKNDYKKLLKAHSDAIKKIKEGTSLKDISLIYKKELSKQKLPAETLEVKELGHSIGFKLHEEPIFFKEEQEEILKENMIITLEPEIKINNYRLRVEDMVLIKKNKSEILTR